MEVRLNADDDDDWVPEIKTGFSPLQENLIDIFFPRAGLIQNNYTAANLDDYKCFIFTFVARNLAI
jgi:hypothetical protein